MDEAFHSKRYGLKAGRRIWCQECLTNIPVIPEASRQGSHARYDGQVRVSGDQGKEYRRRTAGPWIPGHTWGRNQGNEERVRGSAASWKSVQGVRHPNNGAAAGCQNLSIAVA